MILSRAVRRPLRVQSGLPIDERTDMFFECQRRKSVPGLREPDRAADLRRFPLVALPGPVVPHELFVLERVRAGDLALVVTYGSDRLAGAASASIRRSECASVTSMVRRGEAL